MPGEAGTPSTMMRPRTSAPSAITTRCLPQSRGTCTSCGGQAGGSTRITPLPSSGANVASPRPSVSRTIASPRVRQHRTVASWTGLSFSSTTWTTKVSSVRDVTCAASGNGAASPPAVPSVVVSDASTERPLGAAACSCHGTPSRNSHHVPSNNSNDAATIAFFIATTGNRVRIVAPEVPRPQAANAAVHWLRPPPSRSKRCRSRPRPRCRCCRTVAGSRRRRRAIARGVSPSR